VRLQDLCLLLYSNKTFFFRLTKTIKKIFLFA